MESTPPESQPLYSPCGVEYLQAACAHLDQAWGDMEEAFSTVGGYLSRAIHEEAIHLGGEGFAAEVAQVASYDSTLPNPAALELLQARDPEAAQRVLARMAEIGARRAKACW